MHGTRRVPVPPEGTSPPETRRERRTAYPARYRRTAVGCVLTILAGLLGVVALPTVAMALPPGNLQLATWNMQHRTSVPQWASVFALARTRHVVALQELPLTIPNGVRTPLPPTGARPTGRLMPAGVVEYEWREGSTAPMRYLYTLMTDSQHTGMVTAERALEVQVIDGGFNRPALAIAEASTRTLFASIHAVSQANARYDARRLLNSVSAAMPALNQTHPGQPGDQPWNWAVLGDYNTTPEELQPLLLPGMHIARSGQPTQGTGDNRRELDYLVTSLPAGTWPAARYNDIGSDHQPVVFGTLQAAAELDYTYRFRWDGENRMIGAVGDSTANYTTVERSEWRHSLGQVWQAKRMTARGDRFFSQFVNVHANKCLDIDGILANPRLMQKDCAADPPLSQLWWYNPTSKILENAAGGVLALAPQFGEGALGVGHPTQPVSSEWLMEPIDLRFWRTSGFPEGETAIIDGVSGGPLNASEASAGIHESAPLHHPYLPPTERWQVRLSVVAGFAQIVNVATQRCVAVVQEPWHQFRMALQESCDSGNRNQVFEYVKGMIRSANGYVLEGGPGYGPHVGVMFAANSVSQFILRPAFRSPSEFQGSVPRLTVMPLGDSITLGVGSNTRTGYRPDLASSLVGRAGTVEFVGSQVDPDGTRHEGHSGWRIDQLQANIETWLAEAKPNVVTLHIGTNDMNRDYQVSTAPQRLGALIDQIHAASPDTAVVVASLVPATDPAVQARINTYNAAIPGIIADRAQRGYKISQVSMGALTTGDLKDNLHPNNSGYAKMADAFLGGITAIADKGWVKEFVDVKPAPPRQASSVGDYDVDINGDGRADYLVVDDNGATRAWLNTADAATGAVKWADQGYIASGSAAWTAGQIRFANVGGDARADYLIVEPNGAVRAFINTGGNGRGGWSDKGVIATGSTAWTGDQVRFADTGGDAYADYLVVDGNGATRAWLNTTNAATGVIKWADQGYIASGSAAWTGDQVRFADIGGDARADYLLVDDSGATRAFINTGGNGRGGWTNKDYIATGSTGWLGNQIRFADINGDAHADYLVIDDNGAVRSYINTTDAATGVIKWTDQGTIATGVGAPGHRVRI